MTIGDPLMTSLQNTIDRRSALKLIGAVGAWPALAPTIGAAQADVRPFRIHVADEELSDLRRRLANIRWPPDATGKPWSMGSDLAYMKQLVTYWKDRYNWRKHEADLNKVDHYTTVIDGYKIHFIHQKSRNPSAMPIVMTHGYPGTIWEMLPSVAALTDPVTHGGTATDAFHVVVPSLPGYGFSGDPLEDFSPAKVPALWVTLMERLGYRRFGAYGSDWGSGITTQLGVQFADRLIGTAVPGPPPRANREPRTAEERAYAESTARYTAEETAYQNIQGTKPQSLAYGLTDSPAGVAAWIVEKLRAWSDCKGDVESKFTKDQILTLVSIYWHTRTIGTATRIYYSTGRWRTPPSAGPLAAQAQASGRRVPQGYFDFYGITARARPPKSLVDKVPENVTLWSYHESGGHFPAIEEPKLLVDDLRTFFRPLRTA
jgi:pimeloyl-ACP methyl ester carboxylesterase